MELKEIKPEEVKPEEVKPEEVKPKKGVNSAQQVRFRKRRAYPIHY
ncbi:MAG: hypothetical protein NHB15_18890 [Methanosarcina barkeri]|nr:hypothetical protein [Methanosarcina sp. ERenArc_MAG2]